MNRRSLFFTGIHGLALCLLMLAAQTLRSQSVRLNDTALINLGNNAALKLTNFTIEAWIKIEGYGSTTETGSTGGGGMTGVVPIVTKGRAESENAAVDINYFIGYRLSDNRLIADFEDDAGSVNHAVASNAVLPNCSWAHVAVSYNTATDTWKIYINGVLDNTQALGGNFTPQAASNVNACIGSSLNAGSIRAGSFNGRIDEVRIWNNVRTDAQISANYNVELSSESGLVGRWGLNEGTGITAANSGTAGSAANGTLINGSTWSSGFSHADPTTGASIDFNGQHDYVTFGNAAGLNATSFTLEAWIKIEGSGLATSTGSGGVSAVPIVAKGRSENDAPANVNVNYFMGLTVDNKLAADFEEGGGGNHPVTGASSIPSNKWTHVAVTYTQSTGTWKLYINGMPDATLALGSAFTPANTSIQHASVASAINSTGVQDGYFNGKIDEVRIWNTARSDAAILSNYQSELTSGTNLIGRWGFNENCGTVTTGSIGSIAGTLRSDNISTHPTNGGPAWHAFNYNRPPLQPTGINPPDGQVNFAGNQVSLTVTDPESKPLTVKLYGRKKTANSALPNFTVIGIPDTQYYTEEPQGGPGGSHQQASNAIFKTQTQWIANNRINNNIVFTGHFGDCTQNGQANEIEWKRADTSMKRIEEPNVPVTGGMPYSICVGNHDQGTAAGDPTASTSFYNQYFGEARFSGRSYYGGHYGANNDNHFTFFSGSGIDFIYISLEYNNNTGTTNQGILQNVLNWADSLLKAHPNRKGIIASHWIMEVGTGAAFGGPGAQIYSQLKDNPNFMLMLCGHRHGEGRRSDPLDNGGTLNTILADYQGRINGGDGWMRIMEFSPSNNTLNIKTFSPTLNQFETDADSEFSLSVDLAPAFSLISTNTNVLSGSATNLNWSGLLPGTAYEWYVTIDDGESITTSAIFDFTTAGALPVTLLNMRALNEKERVKLEWATSIEINASHFEVEHSADGRSFSKIGEVKAGGRDYYLYDEQPFPHISYYRLKIFDKDGKFNYSKTVHVTRIADGRFAVMPNPALRNEIRLIVEQLPSGPAQINIYDQAGRLQLSKKTILTGQPLIINHNLPAGMYLVEVQVKGIKESQAFVVE
ncbi:MAG: LamG-like jellyroll fold domain-containing protein [Chitinophagaceae bacterium]